MMQSNRTILVLFGVLLLIIGLIVGREYWPKSNEETLTYAGHWTGITPEGVKGLRVQDGEEKLDITRDGEWRVAEYMAEAAGVEETLRTLLQPNRVAVVSETNQQHENLGVGGDAGKQLRVIGTGAEVLVWLGDTTVDGRYLRFDGEDRVYLVDDLGFTISSMDVNDWIEKVIFSAEEAALAALTVTSGNRSIILEQRDGRWYEQGSEMALNRDSLSGMLNTLNSFVTQGLVTEDELETFGLVPEVTVEIIRTDSDPVVLTFYEGEEEQAAVESNERVGMYAISGSLLDNFNIGDEDLVPME